ncbi:kinetochore-associated protein 1 [Callorhinchus milii]|uniref:kinetochore-associated protein 1 n=1 Tax=Callorhinchus milii TaxID=7868 RepID=UPI001C3F5E3B|nr:kinetochore-associated protein 1 [Callorhinchus milii]
MWNDVELLTNDDTGSGRLNIEARGENGAALYQVDTLVKISSSEKVTSSPELHAYSSSDGCVLVVDRSVILLDQTCQSVLLQLRFDTAVDVVGLCLEGQFLMVGERNGNLHLLHVKSRQTLLTNALIKGSTEEDQKTYWSLSLEQDICHLGSYHTLLLTTHGFFWVSGLHLANLQQAIETTDLEAAKALKEHIKIKYIATEDQHTAGCYHAAIESLKSGVQLILGGAGDCVLSKWKVDPVEKGITISSKVDSSMMQDVKKCQILDNLLFVLDHSNLLSMWDVCALVMVWSWPSVHIQDFLLTSEGDSSALTKQENANLKLVALTAQNDKWMRNLLVYSLPTMNLLYSLEVAGVSALVQTGITQDTIYVLEGVYESQKRSPEAAVSAVVMRCLTEALPENRLSRLLHKHKFEEAERFAIQFGLDVELVYKVELNIVLENLASTAMTSRSPSSWQGIVNDAKENLHKIQDDQFVVKYCMDVAWPTFETTLEMLNYAKNRILKKADKNPTGISEEQAAWLAEVLRTQARLVTFHGMFGPAQFSGNTWIEFLNNEDLFNDFLMQLQGGNLTCAQYLWLRHQVEFESKFDVKRLENLLNCITANTPSHDLCLWFKNVIIPFVLRIVPRGKKVIARWLEHRARSLELIEKAHWPENGLQMAELYFVARNPNDLGLATSWLWIPVKEETDCEEMHQLKKLVNNLQELVNLHRKYNCRLALSEFEKETTATIVFRMLDRVLAPELIPSTLEKVIQPYINKHSLQREELLLQYIKDLLERCSSRSASLFETAWEAKAMAVLGCMTDTELIFDAVLQIMYGAVVPWSDAVEELVKQHLEKNHRKVKQLQESYRLMEMKKLLQGYGIRNFNVSNDYEIMRLVNFILKQDLGSSLDDALKVVRAYMLPPVDVYFLRISHLISNGRRDDCLNVLKSLAFSEAEDTAMRLVTWARLKFQDQPDSPEGKKHLVSIAKALVEVLKFLQTHQKDDTSKKEEYQSHLKMFETIGNLQEYFDIFISLRDYESPEALLQLYEEQVQALASTWSRSKSGKEPLVNGCSENKATVPTEGRLYRLSLLLQNSEQQAGGQLALRALADGKVEKALNICSELYEQYKNDQTAQVLHHVAQKLCQMLEANIPMIIPPGMNLPAIIYELTCQAITICSTDFLFDCQELCKCTRVAMDVYRQCMIEDYGFITKMSNMGIDRDPYDEWIFEEFFLEDGIVLNQLSVLPVMYKITAAFVPHLPGKKLYPLDCMSVAMSPDKTDRNPLLPVNMPVTNLLQSLQECSQLQLALQVTINSFGTCFQHFTSNNMSLELSKKLFQKETVTVAKDLVVDMGKAALSLISAASVALLHKVFNCRVVDTDLALAYCTLLPKRQVFEKLWNVINDTWQNYSKVLAVAQVGAQLADWYQESQQKESFTSLIADSEWGLRLSKLGISFQSAFKECATKKKELIPVLVENPNTDSELILQYCRTFELNSDIALQLYVETLLLRGGSAHSGEGEPGGVKPAHTELLARAVEIVPLLKITSDLVVSLNSSLYKMDPYDYEVIEGVLKIINLADEKIVSINLDQALSLLQHLYSYNRVSPLSDLEHEYLMEHSITLSPATKTRLPFHLLFFENSQRFWTIISAELSEETFPTLLLISKLMKVSLDKLYMSAVKHVFAKTLKPRALKQAKEGSVSLITKETAETVQTIQSYILSITNPEWAIAISHWIAQELPIGPDKIQALKFCLQLSENWLNSTSPKDEAHQKAENSLSKLRVEYERSATENVLRIHTLNSPEHLKLIKLPAKLIRSLYEHSSIEERFKQPTARSYPDIHTAANQLAEINSRDINKIRSALLEEWLCPPSQPDAGEMPLEFLSDMQEDAALLRVIYLLQPYPVDYSAKLLSTFATASTSPFVNKQLTFAHRSRALQCLLHIADSKMITAISQQSIEKVKSYLKCCIYLAEFEMLNIPYTTESFHNSAKEGMIKGLWKNHNHEPRAVRLVTELSLEYGVFDQLLWNGILQKLLGFNMNNYLRKVLMAITAVHALWQIPNFTRAWRSVILAPFLTASSPPSPRQLEACYQSFVLLIKCPVLLDVDLFGIAKQFAQLELSSFSLGCLLLVPYSEKKEQQIQRFLVSVDPVKILQQVVDHMSTGEVAGFGSKITKLVLDRVVDEKQFAKLLGTEYFALLKQHMMERKRGPELVAFLMSSNSLNDIMPFAIECLKREGKSVQSNFSPEDILQQCLREKM